MKLFFFSLNVLASSLSWGGSKYVYCMTPEKRPFALAHKDCEETVLTTALPLFHITNSKCTTALLNIRQVHDRCFSRDAGNGCCLKLVVSSHRPDAKLTVGMMLALKCEL